MQVHIQTCTDGTKTITFTTGLFDTHPDKTMDCDEFNKAICNYEPAEWFTPVIFTECNEEVFDRDAAIYYQWGMYIKQMIEQLGFDLGEQLRRVAKREMF